MGRPRIWTCVFHYRDDDHFHQPSPSRARADSAPCGPSARRHARCPPDGDSICPCMRCNIKVRYPFGPCDQGPPTDSAFFHLSSRNRRARKVAHPVSGTCGPAGPSVLARTAHIDLAHSQSDLQVIGGRWTVSRCSRNSGAVDRRLAGTASTASSGDQCESVGRRLECTHGKPLARKSDPARGSHLGAARSLPPTVRIDHSRLHWESSQRIASGADIQSRVERDLVPVGLILSI